MRSSSARTVLSACPHHGYLPLAPVVGVTLDSRRFYASEKKGTGFMDMTKVLGKFAIALGFDWLREVGEKRNMRKMRKLMMQVLPKGSPMPSDEQIKDVLSKPIDPNSPFGRKLIKVLNRNERMNQMEEEDEWSDGEDFERAMLVEQSELEDLMLSPTHLEPLSKLETDAKGYPVLPDAFFMSMVLDPVAGVNPYIVQLPRQRTRRPPFQLFMVNTPEIAKVMVRRCKAAEYVAVDLEHHDNVPTMPSKLEFDSNWATMPSIPPVLPADESRAAVRRSAFGSSIQIAVRHAVPVTLDSRPRVVSSVFYVPLGDIHVQPWKVHALHDALTSNLDTTLTDLIDKVPMPIRKFVGQEHARLLFHGGEADLDVIQNKLRIPLVGAQIADLQVLYTKWKTVSLLHTHIQKSLRLSEPGDHMRNILLKEQHLHVEPLPTAPPVRRSGKGGGLHRTDSEVVLANPTPDQVHAIQSRRLIALNDMFHACDMPKNPLKASPYRKDTLSYQTLYAALDVDMLEHAYAHMKKCTNTIKRDIVERVVNI
ncbi:hypothetical protein GGF31_001702 [Allomyces arbusculus]|nr:hypothetical protein GGF31_001702 [Allomyces arbusculus]